MKKITLILIMMLFCGCGASYNLEITKDSIKESTQFTVSKNKMSLQRFSEQSRASIQSFYSNLDSYYKLSANEGTDTYSFNYSYNYNYSEFEDSFFLRSCYSNSSFILNDNIVTLNTSKKFQCMRLDSGKIDSLKVNIKTKYKVLNHNADSVRGNTYTWYIDASNYQNKPILFEADTNSTISYPFYLGIIALVTLFVITIFIIKKIKNKDEM